MSVRFPRPLAAIFARPRPRGAATVWIAIFALLAAVPAPLTAQVLVDDADIGSVPAAGSTTYSSGVYTINGSGAGVNVGGADAYHYRYEQLTSGGNFRIIARFTGFTGFGSGTNASIGLAVRQDLGASDSMGAIEYFPTPSYTNNPNAFDTAFRNTVASPLLGEPLDPAGLSGWPTPLGPPSSTAPVWMMLVRSNNDFAVYRSPDGSTWTKVENYSGGAFMVNGTIDVGVFVDSGSGSTNATATVDNVTVNTSPVLNYETSWVGNTYSQLSTSYVSDSVDAIAVSPSGIVAAEDPYDEAFGETLKLYEDGEVYRPMADFSAGWWMNGSGYEGTVAWDAISGNTGNHLYFAGGFPLWESDEEEIIQTDPNLNFSQYMLTETPICNGSYGNTGTIECSGIAATGFSAAISNVTYTGSGPITITTSTNHGLTTGQYANITGVGGITAANGNWQVTVINTTQFSLNNSTGSGTYTSGGTLSYGTALYASDAYTGQVLVMNPSQVSYLAPNPGYGNDNEGTVWNNVVPASGSTLVTIPSSLTNPAPQAVYQSQFEANGGGISFDIPGLSTTTTYTVRLHFAEFKATAAGQRVVDIVAGNQGVSNYDILGPTSSYGTGGLTYTATILPIPNVTTSTGTLYINLEYVSGTTGTPVINGIEIDNGSTPVFELACGGAAVSGTSWQSSINEVPSSDFSFTRPGPIAVDKRGNLWIIQEGVNWPAAANLMLSPATHNGAVYCYSPSGAYQGKSITNLENPIGIAYDSINDRILVADNGPDYQNVQVYTNLTTTPSLYGTFGQAGGLFQGSSTDAGLLDDPGNNGYARFFGITGVALDSSDNVYVAENSDDEFAWRGAIHAFNTSGAQLWDVEAQEFTNAGDFDPLTGDIYTSDHHYAMDYLNSTAGTEYSNYAYTWDPYQPYAGTVSGLYNSTLEPGFATIVRRFGSSNSLFVFSINNYALNIYAVVGQQMIPCGEVFDDGGYVGVWVDGSNGGAVDGVPEPSEITTGPGAPAGFGSFDVDSNGDIWIPCGYTYGASTVIELKIQGVTQVTGTYGTYYIPQYALASGDYAETTPPAPFTDWWNFAHSRYFPATDTMYLCGFTNPYYSDYLNYYSTYGETVQRINNWSQGPSGWTVAWTSVLPSPIMGGTVADDFIYEGNPYIYGDGFQYDTFDVENDKVFSNELYGTLHVLDANTGDILPSLITGPDNSGSDGWCDNGNLMKAHYSSTNNEYDITYENSGDEGHDNLYRWSPFAGVPTPDALTITGATDASPIQITTAKPHGLATGAVVNISSVGGNTAADGTWTVTVTGTYTVTLNGSTGNGAYTSGGVMDADNGIPADEDVGSPTTAGYATFSGATGDGTFSITGAGTGITGASDQFHMASSYLDGNGSYIARVTGLSGTGSTEQVGIMLRNSLAANDMSAAVYITEGGSLVFAHRLTSGASTGTTTVSGISPTSDEYIMITRTTTTNPGDTFTAYYHSNTSTTWTKIASTTIDMGDTVYAGLVCSSRSASTLVTGTLDHVLISTIPQPATVTPAGLKAAWSSSSQASVAVNWQAVPGVQDYNIYRGTSSGGEGSTAYATGITTPYYSDTSVSAGSTYYYKVTSITEGTESAKSSQASTAAFLSWNPSFEWPNVSYGTYSQDPSGAGWSFLGSSGICSLENALYGPYPYPDGGQCSYLQLGNGNASGSGAVAFSQSLSGFTVNKTYTFKFYGAQQFWDTSYPVDNEVISVYMDSTLIGTFTPTDTWTWQQFSFTYKPTSGTSHTLTFAGSGTTGAGGNATAFIDDITVSPAL